MTIAHTTVAATDGGYLATWTAIANGAQGDQLSPASWQSAFFQATGTFGSGGSVRLEGSNDGANWFPLSPAALTAPGSFAPLGANEKPQYVRPNVTAGDGTTAIAVTAFYR